ncbi:MAG TPA: Asp23/Gls24 family envelope stress response protein [Acidimicrobiales bacterium]|jgi:uncharacterized alkaline shock family protein YloU|nr:Asp23/Gls24 family envelope stress response protein [Acidimicrobiales bacterium]
MTDFSGDNLGTPNGLPTTKSPPPFPPRGDERPPMSREPAAAAPVPAAAPATPSLASTAAASSASVGQANGAGPRFPAEVKGRIDVADEVVEKVAALAAVEVEGVADLGGDIERAIESVRERIGIGHKRGDQGVKARISGREVAVDVTIMIEYGYVVMDVARAVKNNVAHQTNRMLGLNVVEVNVTVDDVKMPQPVKPAADQREADGYQ